MRLPLPIAEIKKLATSEGLISSEKFDELYDDSERKNQSVVDALISSGYMSADYLSDLIAKTLGVKRADLSKDKLNTEIVKLLPEDIARQRQVIMLSRENDGSYDVAMVDPSDLETVSFLSQRFQARINPMLATQEDLNRGFSIYGYELGQDFKKLIEDNIKASLASHAQTAEEAASELPIVGIVDNVLSYGLASRASDIHIEILEDSLFIRYRIDGILYEVMDIPKAVHSAVVARLKLLAGLKLDEHFKPQDGRFRYMVGSQRVDVRVSVIPTFYGEKVEMRLLEASQKPLSLEELGFNEEDTRMVRDELKKSYGMVLSCGPTGSGKTTTLYALMSILNKPEINITTIEDPIEYNMRYVNQMQINPQAGITFESGLRAVLRQDPNVVMVGEIRDGETADIAVQASLTGHLILSSLHTNDAPTAIPRFFDLKVPPFLVVSVLNLVIAQRLVREICQNCIYSYTIDPSMEKMIEREAREMNIPPERARVQKVQYRGKGCPICGMTGYRGRLGIYELLRVTEDIRQVILAPSFDLEALRAAARRGGMKTMFEDGLQKVELAQTTLEEVLRVIRG